MRAELQAYLDGELRFEELPAELQEQASGWDAVLADLDDLPGVGESAPVWIEAAVMDEVGFEDGETSQEGLFRWLTRPREVRVSPLWGGLAAAALAAVMVLTGRGAELDGTPDATTIYVQFTMEAPSARSVAVAGDFNDWEAGHELTDTDGDGVWTGRIAVQPGIHEYMFVIDGSEWVTPPTAEGYRDDGFGSRNAVVTVLPAA